LFVADRVRSFHPGAATQGANAVLVVERRIAAVGDYRDLRPRAVDVVEFEGTTITPGLTDAHIHVTEWALARREVDLTAASSAAEAARTVRERGRKDAGGWIRGRGWDAHRWNAGPHRALLDEVLPDVPVALQSHDMHSLWANSAALARAAVSASTADPPGGRIERDDAGEPTGVMRENATQLIIGCLPVPDFDPVCDAVLEAQDELHSMGITGVHSLPGLYVPEPDPLSVLESLRARDRLRLRVLQHLPVQFLDEAIRLGLRSGFGGDWIRIGGVKMFLDGALGSRTAWMRRPYETAQDCGMRVLPAEDFRAAVARAAAHGLATTVHAIGDAAVELAMQVLADPAVRVHALPHRIEHVQCLPAGEELHALVARLVAQSVTCSMQPAHLISDWRAADRHWGSDRSRWTYAIGYLSSLGAVLAFGSDAPVEPADPRLGLFAATRRTDLHDEPAGAWQPAERIRMEEALRGYTFGPALAAGRHADEGAIVPGAFADLVAWHTDPLTVDDPRTLECAATIVGGELVRD
jgi:predicted amidohydrolase YtcJ